jgi:hypothetical protein
LRYGLAPSRRLLPIPSSPAISVFFRYIFEGLEYFVAILDFHFRWRIGIPKNHDIGTVTDHRRENNGVDSLPRKIVTDFLGRSVVIPVEHGLENFFEDSVTPGVPQIHASSCGNRDHVHQAWILVERDMASPTQP